MRTLRCAIILFASSMVVKTLLVALFTLWGLITARELPISISEFIKGVLFFELVFAIPLYLIYLPIYLYRTEHGNHSKGFLRLTALFIGFALFLLNEMTEPIPAYPANLAMFAAWTVYLLATFELHMHQSKKEDNISAEERTKLKISHIFYWIGIPAALIAGVLIGISSYIFIVIHSCLLVPVCSTDLMIEWWSQSGHTLEIIGLSLLAGILFSLAFYICILYPLYGFFIKRLWWQNKRSYAHFALAATTTIFWMGLSYFIFSPNFNDLEQWQMLFFFYSYTVLITSVLHLKILKEYDLRYGIPYPPPHEKRWYDRFLGIKSAEAEA